MADDPPRRGRGRPRLPEGQRCVSAGFTLRASEYERACRIAAKHRVSVAAVFRKAWQLASRRPDDDLA